MLFVKRSNKRNEILYSPIIKKLLPLAIILLFLSSSALVFATVIEDQSAETALLQYESLTYYHEDYMPRYVAYKELHPNFTWEQVIGYVDLGLDRPFYSFIQKATNRDQMDCLVNKYNGLSWDYVPTDLLRISQAYSQGTFYLKKEATVAFEAMCKEAGKLGLRIKAVSAYRDYGYQSNLYNRLIHTDDLSSIRLRDQQVARPGHSEHQLGLAVDVKGVESWVENTAEYAWYAKNAHRYGFVVRYLKGKEAETGYRFEPWHLRYLGPDLATQVYESGQSYDVFYTIKNDVTPKAESLVVQVTIGEKTINFDGLRYKNKIYVKMQDIALALQDTSQAFSMTWQTKESRLKLTKEQSNQLQNTYVQPPLSTSENSIVAVQVKTLKLLYNNQEATLQSLHKDSQNFVIISEFFELLGV